MSEWRPIPGYEDLYEVSSEGVIRSLKSGKALSTRSSVGSGYVQANLWKNGVRKRTTMHRVVAEAFFGPATGGMEVNHKNGIKTDNRVSNLEWCSRSHNVNHCCYELGHLVRAVRAVPVTGGEPIEFASIELAVRKGFNSGSIYRCLGNPALTHRRYRWERPTNGAGNEQ